MNELAALLASTVRNMTPLAFAALGGMFSERSGVINIGLEGMMLMSAFAGVAGAVFTGSTVLGLLIGVAVGLLLGLVHAIATVTFEADQIISGTAINLLALGGTGFLMVAFFGSGGTSPRIERFPSVAIPVLSDIPVIGRGLFNQSVLVYLLYLLVPVCWYLLYRSPFGLRLRAVGEVPEAVDVAGVSVVGMRYIGVSMSGMLAGLGGAFLSMSLLSAFTEGMTGGRGFIALAALIFGRWNPVGAFLAAALFGAAQAVVFRGLDVGLDQEFIEMFPYVLVIVALVGFGGRAVPPAAIGKPYRKE